MFDSQLHQYKIGLKVILFILSLQNKHSTEQMNETIYLGSFPDPSHGKEGSGRFAI